jgi:hypothetical protein
MLSAFCVLAGVGFVWSSQVQMHFVSSLTLDEAGQPVGICILVLAGVGLDCSTRFETPLCLN